VLERFTLLFPLWTLLGVVAGACRSPGCSPAAMQGPSHSCWPWGGIMLGMGLGAAVPGRISGGCSAVRGRRFGVIGPVQRDAPAGRKRWLGSGAGSRP